jgi:hypothetical protein
MSTVSQLSTNNDQLARRQRPNYESIFTATMFFEYGMAVAAAYAIKRKVNAVLFTKKRIR